MEIKKEVLVFTVWENSESLGAETIKYRWCQTPLIKLGLNT